MRPRFATLLSWPHRATAGQASQVKINFISTARYRKLIFVFYSWIFIHRLHPVFIKTDKSVSQWESINHGRDNVFPSGQHTITNSAPQTHNASVSSVSPQLRRCQKPPRRLSLRELQPPPQQPQCTGVWPTLPPQQGSRRAAGERPSRPLWFHRLLPHRPSSPSLYPSASARPPRKET